MIKITNSKRYHGSVSLFFMVVLSCVTQLLTLLKSTVVAGTFGTSMEMDAFVFSNSIVSFLFGFISAAISTVIIPQYAATNHRKGIDSFITLLFAVIAGVIGIIFAIRYPLISLLVRRGGEYTSIASQILVILLISNYFFSFTYITTGYYQSIERFNIPKFLNLLTQAVVVGTLCVLKNITIIQYAMIIGAGFLANLLADVIIATKLGWRYIPNFRFRDEDTRRLVRLFLPIIFSTGIYRISLFIDAMITSRLETGQMSILGYATQIVSMINSLLIGNLLIYCYPKIVNRIHEDNSQTIFWEQASLFHLVVCLLIAGFATVGRDGISLLLEHGNFDATATQSVFVCSIIYVSGQQTNIVRDLIYRYFYASGDTKTPASNSVLVSVVNIVTSLILVQFMGLYGIAVGTITASAVSLLRILLHFRKKIGFQIQMKSVLFSFIKNIIITILTISLVQLTKYAVSGISCLGRILIFGSETVAVFVVLTILLKRETITTLKKL